MKNKKSWVVWSMITPLLSLIIWLIISNQTLISYINILFYISLSMFICIFFILLVQEGIFDATSYGFRRIRYQLSSRSKKRTMADDEFLNPQQVKKEHYFISTLIAPALICNIAYFVMTIIISFLL